MEIEKVKDAIVSVLDVDREEITLETKFVDDLGADSLDVFQIISELEDEYTVEFDIEEAENMETVGDAVEYIKKLI